MPNKTIYVADNDLPLFEQAQELSGANLSATLVEAVRQYIESFKAKEKEGEIAPITVKVGTNGNYQTKQFNGRLLARYRLGGRNLPRLQHFELYLTAKGKYALYYRQVPNWTAWSTNRGWEKGENWNLNEVSKEYRLEVYDTLEQVRDNAPIELYEIAERALKGENIEILDI